MVDNLIILDISFNNQEYYEVTSISNTLQYSELARIKAIRPTFGFADALNFTTTMYLSGLNFWEMDEFTFGNFTRNIRLLNLNDYRTKIALPNFVNISNFDNSS